MKSRYSRLALESLERRDTPAVFNNPWPDPQALTLSFATDGSNAYGQLSSLNTLLAASAGSVAAGQFEILRAYQTWASVANINIGVVSDGGSAFGLPGPLQGNPNAGDLRVGARTIGSTELAVATPFDLFGTSAGDVLFNTQYGFSIGGGNGKYDLYTVALQETGHTLGLPNSPNTGSVMYTTYGSPRTGLGTGDVAALQALYGARSPDRFDATASNATTNSASTLAFAATLPSANVDPTAGSNPLVAVGDLTTATDVDIYKVSVPSDQNSLTVQLRTSGVSLTRTRLSILNSSGTVLASTFAADPLTGNLALTVAATPGASYYLKVDAAPNAGIFGIGAYRLAAGPQAQAVLYPSATAYVLPDSHNDDVVGSSKDKGSLKIGGDARWELVERASISDATDKDVIKFQVDKGSPPVLVASVWGTSGGTLDPSLRLLDKDGKVLSSGVLANDGRAYTIQYVAIKDGTYYLEVSGAGTTGNYFLGADLRSSAITLGSYSSSLSAANPEQVFQIDVPKDRLYHFVLKTGTVANVEAAVRITLYDLNHNPLGTFMAQEGQTVSADMLLSAGSYYYKVAGGAKYGAVLPNLAYTLSSIVRNDPIGPGIIDPTLNGGATIAADPSGGDDIFATFLPWLDWIDVFSDPFSSL